MEDNLPSVSRVIAFVKRTHRYLGLAIIVFILPLFVFQIFSLHDIRQTAAQAQGVVAPRGETGDLWADIVIGKRDFGEISPNEIVPNKLDNPGGVIVDRSTSPGRMYVWDSGNSRIVGIDLQKCYQQKAANPSSGCSADIVIGQPSGNDYGGCNRDSSFATYPYKAKSGPDTLCGMRESTQTTLEDKSFASMWVDSQGNLYVPDIYNNRVLKYNSPFTTDQIADEVYGQDDFIQNYCNKTPVFSNPGNPDFSNGSPAPTESTICFNTTYHGGAGVTTDDQGNIWVADGGNNRVLRFAPGSKTANLVLGQNNFTSGPDQNGNALNQLNNPNSLRFDQQGRLFVNDSGNNRVLIFTGPFTNGMSASGTFINNQGFQSLDISSDPTNSNQQVVWTIENVSWHATVKLWNMDGSLRLTMPPGEEIGNSGGSLGIDALGNILISSYLSEDVHLLSKTDTGTYSLPQGLFPPSYMPNMISTKRLQHPAWAGVAVAGNQLLVADGRLLIWNDKNRLTNGAPPDASFPFTEHHGSTHVESDSAGRIWMLWGHEDAWDQQIAIFQNPLTPTSQPIKTISFPLPTVDGGTIAFTRFDTKITDIAITPDSKYVWVSLTDSNRVMRIKDPLTNPVVDVVLGQKDLAGKECNRGLVPPPSSGTALRADLSMLCNPGGIAVDKKGNLFVSDHFLEASGNFRLLMFAKNTFPDAPTSVIFDPDATKEFPRESGFATWDMAFDSTNRMVVGFNPYLGSRFPAFFNDPTAYNPSNPKDPAFAQPDGSVKDFYNWAVATVFDSQDNLYIYDANRGQVRIYNKPFSSGTVTPTPQPSVFSSVGGNFTATNATFTFNYTGTTSKYIVDVSTLADMSYDVYLSFVEGAASPLQVSNPQTKWDKYSCGRTLYWRVYNADRSVQSPIQTTTVTCAVPTPTRAATPTPTKKPTPTPTRIPTPTPTPSDITPPTVMVTSPTNNSTIPRSGKTLISASASDISGISKVEFYVNNSLTCTDSTASYSCSWSVRASRGTVYSLTTKAYDKKGNSKVSTTVRVTTR